MRINRFVKTLAISVGLIVCLPSASARSVPAHQKQPLDAVRAAAAKHAQAALADEPYEVTVKARYLDPRLRLKLCAHELETFTPRGARKIGNTTVGVRCSAPTAWNLYVPVTVEALAPALVAKRFLARGTLIGQDDVSIAIRNVSSFMNGYLDSASLALGMRVKRPIRKGAPVTSAALAKRKLVRRGDRVMIVAGRKGVQIRAAGKALADGAAGDVVRVRNLRSKRTVEGEVVARNTVSINF
jgi:flagellar basal body P-ring formation protein FlgA